MQLTFFDDIPQAFLPLTYTRSIAELRMGSLTLAEKWILDLGAKFSYTANPEKDMDTLFINSRCLPRPEIKRYIDAMQENEALVFNGTFLAIRQKSALPITLQNLSINPHIKQVKQDEAVLIKRITDLFNMNEEELKQDFSRLSSGTSSKVLPEGNQIIGDPNKLFLAPGAKVQGAILNVTEGPIYIGKNAEVMEGALIRGPFSLGDHATVKMGAKIYGATTIGPWSKVGGEVSNSVILGYSNKGHDGFLGNSILGMWCNLGADTNTSNLKNNYSSVRVWDYASKKMEDTGLTFCGLIMGDHSKCSINTMFNTGTTVGVAANIFGGGFPPKFIPSFSWGGADEMTTHNLQKAIETAERVMARRGISLTPANRKQLEVIFAKSAEFRS